VGIQLLSTKYFCYGSGFIDLMLVNDASYILLMRGISPFIEGVSHDNLDFLLTIKIIKYAFSMPIPNAKFGRH